MGNHPASLQEARRLKTPGWEINPCCSEISMSRSLLWMGNHPVAQRAPQAEDPWMGNHSVPLQDVHKLKTAVLTETQTSYTLLSGP